MSRKPLPLAEVIWNIAGKKLPIKVPRILESDIADLATRLCQNAAGLVARVIRTEGTVSSA
jgi:hypothetical protein